MTNAEKIRKSLVDNDAPLLAKAKKAAEALIKDAAALNETVGAMVHPESLTSALQVISSTATNMVATIDHIQKRYEPEAPAPAASPEA
jgi:hypothetical protein